MDSKQIKEIEKQAGTIVDDIKELKRQIAAYKSGAEAFESSAEALNRLVDEQSALTKEINIVFTDVKNLDVVKIVDGLKYLGEKVESVDKRMDAVDNDISRLVDDTNKKFAKLESKVEAEIKVISDMNASIGEQLKSIEERTKTGVKTKLFGKVN